MTLAIEEQLVNHIANRQFSDLDHETVNCCKKLVLDSFGVMFPGTLAPGCPEIIELARSWQCFQGSSVFIHNFSTAPPLAAMTNSTMMHALDFDDTLDESALHTFVNVLPASLAAAEYRGKISGKELIVALTLGADIVCRLSLAVNSPLSWIRTATCGCFGAATAAGIILGLDKGNLLDALGIVYSQAAGNAQGLIESRLVKRMQPGFAASAGVLSSFLARKGITGSHRFLTGSYGFYPLYEHDNYQPERITETIGTHYTIKDISIKPYPCCRMTHSAIDAALKLRQRVETVNDIEQIEVWVSSMVAEMVGKPFQIGDNPQVDAQFSIPYTVACALLYGEVFLYNFESFAIDDPDVKRLAENVHVFVDPSLQTNDIFQAELSLLYSDGSNISEYISIPLGNPRNPMSYKQCKEKFNKCLEYSGIHIKEQNRQEIISMVEELENLHNVIDLIYKIRF